VAQSPIALHRKRFAEDPDAQGAFEALEEHWYMQAEWAALADLYRHRLTAPSLADRPRQRAEIALRLGQVLEERLSDGDGAVRAYTEAVRQDPRMQAALQHLRRLYAARQSWEIVLQIAEQEIEVARSPQERARLYAEMGDVWLRELDDATQAEQLYARARDESGGGPVGPGEPAPTAREEQVPSAPAGASDAESSEALRHAAWLAAARGDADTAVTALQRALVVDANDAEAVDMLLGVLEDAERHEEMTALLERRAALAHDPETRGAVWLRLGEVHEHLGHLAEAREAFERALDAHPEHAATREALCRVYRATEAWGSLRALLEGAATAAPASARADLLCRLAELLDRQFADPEAARERLEQAAALAPDDPAVREALERHDDALRARTSPELGEAPARGEQRATRVVGVLERKLASLEERGEGRGKEAQGLRVRIGDLRAGPLGDPASAVVVLEPLLDDDEALLEVAPLLARLYDPLGRLEDLAALAERAGHLSVPSEQRVDWFRRAAETARALGDAARAIGCYRSLLAESPNDAAARGALCDLYRSRGEIEPLVALLRSELARSDESRELEIHLELAQIFSESLRDGAACIAHLRRALEIEPGRLDLLERALELCDGPLARLDLIELAAWQVDGDAARARLLARRGTLFATDLAWPEEAAESWRASLTLDPEQPELRAKLASVGA